VVFYYNAIKRSMQILYISALSSERLIDEIRNRTGKNPGYAIQKFSRLLVKGLMANGADVSALSNPPITRGNSSAFFVHYGKEVENDIRYRYVPFLNAFVLKHICVVLYSFFYVLFWGLTKRKEKAIICDVMTVGACIGSLLASKINRVKSVGVVTDIYAYLVGGTGKKSLISTLACKINEVYVSGFDKYVLLTEKMNSLVNPKGKPHIVMEALCDSQIGANAINIIEKTNPRTILYAGGIHEKYGIRMLVEAFLLSGVDGKLIFYGDGPYVKELKLVCENTDKVEYRGVAPNKEVMLAECEASILVNPRFTTEVFSPYSFPSKNMEYMASGTPLLTTNLPGMPEEYREYVYLFKNETIDGYAKVISDVFSKSGEELCSKGAMAKQFVLEKKNNIAQAKRVVDFI